MTINTPPPQQLNCAVSVVMAMYNAEKYIAETLESLLAQTFQDFEVILVNDCSTDNSRAIAESYFPKFGGRLKIFDNEKNSGAATTRNNGLRRAKGEYVFYFDSDDLILPSGLEEIYTVAKRFDVDVVNSTKSYRMSNDGKTLTPHNLRLTRPNDESILEYNLEWRFKGLLMDKFAWAPWRRLLRREFLIENNLFFPENIRRNEDEIWTMGLLFRAKRILHIPLPIVLYRLSDNSITRIKRTPVQNVISRIDNIIHHLKWLNDILGKIPFFIENPDHLYAILEYSTKKYLVRIFKECRKVSPTDMYLAIKQEFGKSFGEYDVTISVLCTMLSNYQKIIEQNKTRIAELEEQLKAK